MHQLGEFEELVLMAVAVQHTEAYGVSIHRFLEDETGRKINISSIHAALGRLEDRGLVKSGFGAAAPRRGGRRKRIYLISAAGKKVLDEKHSVRREIYNKIPQITFSNG